MPVQRRPARAARPHAHAQSGFDGGAEDFPRLGGNQGSHRGRFVQRAGLCRADGHVRGTGATLIASEDLITEARIVDFQENDRYTPQHDDSAVLQFSSGSTGMPKGARLTHRNLIANIRALRAIEGGTSEDRLVTWLPYFHDFGLFGCHLMPMLAGMDQIKMDPFQFAQRPFLWMEKIHEHRATITSATNTGN